MYIYIHVCILVHDAVKAKNFIKLTSVVGQLVRIFSSSVVNSQVPLDPFE